MRSRVAKSVRCFPHTRFESERDAPWRVVQWAPSRTVLVKSLLLLFPPAWLRARSAEAFRGERLAIVGLTPRVSRQAIGTEFFCTIPSL